MEKFNGKEILTLSYGNEITEVWQYDTKSVDFAMQVIQKRSSMENVNYNANTLYWLLLGIYYRDGKEAMIKWAENITFAKGVF